MVGAALDDMLPPLPLGAPRRRRAMDAIGSGLELRRLPDSPRVGGRAAA